MRHDVVVVGSINVDLVVTVDRHPRPGETLLGGSGQYLAGGKGANQAVAAARLGARTAMVGAVGDDELAVTALGQLRDASVNLDEVRTAPGPTGLAVIAVAADGENTIVVVPGANSTVTREAVHAAAGAIADASVLVVQAEIPLDSVAEAVRLAADAGVRVVVNVAPAAVLPWPTLRAANPLVVNEHEAATLLAGLAAEDGRGDDETPAAVRAAHRFRAHGVPSVVVTLGGAGSVVVDDTGEHTIAPRSVPVADTTGAGDGFVGALAAKLAGGATLIDATEHATRVAAYSVQRVGTQASYPWRHDPLP